MFSSCPSVPSVQPVGDHGVLLDFPDNASVHLAAGVARTRLKDRLVEVVPGDRTLLLLWTGASIPAEIAEIALERADPEIAGVGADPREVVVIPTVYDGADLEQVAAQLGIAAEAVVALHSEARYTVAFVGFAPGFPYLRVECAGSSSSAQREPNKLLGLPRLKTPRTNVPAGSVAVAAGYGGIYPRASPGGWNLLGRTDVVLFEPQRDPPALLLPGMRVRFEPVEGA